MNVKLGILVCVDVANLLGENKHTFCEGNERGALLVTSNEVSLVANAEVKVGKFHNKEVNKQVFLTFKCFGTTLTIKKQIN